MSVHTRKTVPPHKHVSSEVVDAREVRPNRPAQKGVHATDVIVDGTLTLAETNVEWTRHWEESKFTKDEKVTIEDDASAKNGKVAKIPSDQGDIYEPLDTPSIKGEISGEIYVLFCLKVASKASSDTLCRLRVVGSSTVRGYKDIKPSDFPDPDQWHIFAIRGRIEADDTNAYADINNFKGGITELRVDWIGILPTNVPIGYADVTTDSHSGTDTDAHSGTDTDAHSGTDTDAHSGTTAASTALSWSKIADSGMGSEQEVTGGPSGTLIRQLTVSPPAGSQPLVAILCRWERGASGGYGKVQFFLNEATNTRHCWYSYVDDNIPTGCVTIMLYFLFGAGTVLNLYARCDGGESVYIKGEIEVWQSPNHTHTITNPSNHVVTDPSNHVVTDPSNHVVTDPSDHEVTEYGREH